MVENGFLQVLQALGYLNVFQGLLVSWVLHLDSFWELFDEVTGCDETSCEDTGRIGRIDGWSVC